MDLGLGAMVVAVSSGTTSRVWALKPPQKDSGCVHAVMTS